ncbi:hypothetical protein ANCCEY_02964 [Ancylostoma ceylanicum]|uniref:Uncharacterized protein n=1 Tax=Ancylostoma ceylanicum TaxID=53326 RepID=A0A0D6M3B3_9BILA|nr:hypothetical protein ANCCEY_02964 [Ancylostoma ceylanicum]
MYTMKADGAALPNEEDEVEKAGTEKIVKVALEVYRRQLNESVEGDFEDENEEGTREERRTKMRGVSLVGVAICLFVVPGTSSFVPALLVFSLAMACRGLHHGGVSVNPHDFAPHHTGAVFG